MCVDDKHRFAMWDAAYVLGCLTPCDRREFEVHIAHCSACWEATAELSGMPAMLSQLDPSELAAINEFGDLFDIPKISAQLLPSVLATVRQQRRRSRLITCAAAAAAALLAISVFVGFPRQFHDIAAVAHVRAGVADDPGRDQIADRDGMGHF